MRRILLLLAAFAATSFPNGALSKPSSDLDVPITRCYKEPFPVGTGIGLNDADNKSNRNLIYAMDMLVIGKGDPRKGTATVLGYLLHVANGQVYFEAADSLAPAQKAQAVRQLQAWGVTNAAYIAENANFLRLLRDTPRKSLSGLRIMHCTSLGQNE